MGRLSPQGVAIVLKRALLSAGLDASGFSGHSLRAGHATQAALNAASERAISNQTGHKSLATLRRYIRTADAFRENPAKSLGL